MNSSALGAVSLLGMACILISDLAVPSIDSCVQLRAHVHRHARRANLALTFKSLSEAQRLLDYAQTVSCVYGRGEIRRTNFDVGLTFSKKT